MLSQPAEKPPQRDEAPIDRRSRLPQLSAQMIPAIGNVSGRHSADREGLSVGRREPASEFPQVVAERFERVWGVVVRLDKLLNEGRHFLIDRDAPENIIGGELAALWTGIGHHF